MPISQSARWKTDSGELTKEVSRMVTKLTGVQLGDRQSHMVANRVRKRILELGLPNEESYLEFLRLNRDSEATALVSLLTTHHTYFFREFAHFEYLERVALPTIIRAKRKSGEKTIRVWSAACSRGQEAYSLSMLLSHALARIAPDFTYEILGTDVDPESIAIAKNGVYHKREIQEIPLHFINGSWAKGTGEIEPFVRARSRIKAPCRFETRNLLEAKDEKSARYDLIFCRNVFIYFSSAQVGAIAQDLTNALTPEGYLFVGISESLNGLGLPLTAVGPSIYAPASRTQRTEETTRKVLKVPLVTSPLRVLCVDDSPVILSLLKKILAPEQGFEVVTTANNGREALSALELLKVDLVTLDIHMPEVDGLAFLRAHTKMPRPPVVMISSVSREDADLALKCLEAGAVDYVEKPALANLEERADEIRMKLRYAAELAGRGKPGPSTLDESFARQTKITDPERKLRVLLAGISDHKRVAACLKELPSLTPPALLFVEGAGSGLIALQSLLEKELGGGRVVCPENPEPLACAPGKVYLLSSLADLEAARARLQPKLTSVLVFGQSSKRVAGRIQQWNAAQILLEERKGSHPLSASASDTVPSSSFAYLSQIYLAGVKS